LLFSTIKRFLVPKKISKSKKTGICEDSGAPSGTPAADLPGALAGVDLSSGLGRMAGNRELYSRILKIFASKYRDLPNQILQAINQNNFQQAADLTHSILGIAGNIGAQPAFEALRQLESALKKNEPVDDCRELYQTAYENVDSVFAAIDRWLENLQACREADDSSGEADVPCDTAMDVDGIRQAVEDLKSYLNDYNTDALEVLARLEGLTRGQHRGELGEIRELVDELEFDAALDKLNALSGIWPLT
jgi:polar amino acid transport system substrate-binding protein